MCDPGDEHAGNESGGEGDEYEFLDAEVFASSIAVTHVAVALEVFKRFMDRTDGNTAREALADALTMVDDPYAKQRSIPETEAMYQFKISLGTILEMAVKEALDRGVD